MFTFFFLWFPRRFSPLTLNNTPLISRRNRCSRSELHGGRGVFQASGRGVWCPVPRACAGSRGGGGEGGPGRTDRLGTELCPLRAHAALTEGRLVVNLRARPASERVVGGRGRECRRQEVWVVYGACMALSVIVRGSRICCASGLLLCKRQSLVS